MKDSWKTQIGAFDFSPDQIEKDIATIEATEKILIYHFIRDDGIHELVKILGLYVWQDVFKKAKTAMRIVAQISDQPSGKEVLENDKKIGEKVVLSLSQDELAREIANMESVLEVMVQNIRNNKKFDRATRERDVAELTRTFEVATTAMKMIWLNFENCGIEHS